VSSTWLAVKIEKDRKQVTFFNEEREKKIHGTFLPNLQISRLTLGMCSRRRYCYHSIFVLHLMNDKDRMRTIALIASSLHLGLFLL